MRAVFVVRIGRLFALDRREHTASGRRSWRRFDVSYEDLNNQHYRLAVDSTSRPTAGGGQVALPMDEYLDRVEERAKKKRRPVSELLFEDFCQQGEINLERLEVEELEKGVFPKTPDYELQIDGRTIIAEVKEITQNKEEKESERLLMERGYGTVLGGKPGARVRKKINDSSPQIRKRTLGRHPGILILYDYGQTAKHLNEYHIMTAMYGLEVMDVAVPANPSSKPYSMGTRFGPGNRMRQDAKTSISAIGVLAVTAPSGFIRLDVFHNRYAAVAIDPAVLAHDGITQYQIDIGTKTWVKIP